MSHETYTPETTTERDALRALILERRQFTCAAGSLTRAAEYTRRACKVSREFANAARAGLVRLSIVPDDAAPFDFGDTFNEEMHAASVAGGARTIRAQYKRELSRLEDAGAWGIVGEYRTTPGGVWADAASIWGFVADDWKGSGYDVDVMAETLEALRVALRERCHTCKGSGVAPCN